jgi:hypothetical protein
VLAALPPRYQHELSPQARWLFRTLHAAEMAGLDPDEVIRTAVASWDLAGARDIASVLNVRIRQRVDPLLPQPQGSWASSVPQQPDPERRAYLAQIAAMMDDRTRRLGQHTAQTGSAWTVTSLGPLPADPASRHHWEQQAASIAAYREMYGYDHPDDPIGPEPSREKPDQRAAWHQAFAALSPADGPGVRAMPDGRLCLLRDTYAAETAWAPRHVGKELRLSRLGALDADLGALRAEAEAEAARKGGDHDRAGQHETLAASYRALRDLYRKQEQVLARAMADREKWEQATPSSRHLAIAADAELRRRHPDQQIEPLRSAEPALVSHSECEQLRPDSKSTEADAWIRDPAAQRQAFRARLNERQDPDWARLGQTLPSWWAPRRDAILQPPQPQITPTATIPELTAECDISPEAAG